jgi:hypothetical protein
MFKIVATLKRKPGVTLEHFLDRSKIVVTMTEEKVVLRRK